MPRARNTTSGPEADRLDAAAKARDKAEDAAALARLEVLNALVAAIDADMSIAEAARRAGYTREHASKLYSTAKNTDPERVIPRKKVGRPRKATPPAM